MTTTAVFITQLQAHAPQGDRALEREDASRYYMRLTGLAAWTADLPADAAAHLRDILLEYASDDQSDGLAALAAEALAKLGKTQSDAVIAVLEKLLAHPAAVPHALQACLVWESELMLPALATLIEAQPAATHAYHLANALVNIDGEEAIRLLNRMLEVYEDDADLYEHIQEAIYFIED